MMIYFRISFLIITILGWKRTKDERARDEKEKKKLEEEAKQEAKAKEVDENANHVQVIMKTHGYESQSFKADISKKIWHFQMPDSKILTYG